MVQSTMMINFPSVSIAIPVYNEANSIEKLLRSFLQTSYPNLIEVMIADGGSTDGSQEIVENLAQEDPRVKLLHNPLKFQAPGLNLILEQCSGDIFLRADAHADYANDYIERCVETLLESRSLNVGGAPRFVAKTPFQGGIALASKSILGTGGAKHRDPNYDGYADTVFNGCFWRKDLLAISGYSTEAIVNEDAELNIRLRKYYHNHYSNTRSTGIQSVPISKCIYVSSKIRTWYYPRKNWTSLVIQYFKYGGGRCLTTTKHDWKLQIRGMMPFICILALLVSIVASCFIKEISYPVLMVLLTILSLIFLESFRVCWKYRHEFITDIWRGDRNKIPSFITLYFNCILILITLPVSHFSGYTYQIIKTIMWQHKIQNVS